MPPPLWWSLSYWTASQKQALPVLSSFFSSIRTEPWEGGLSEETSETEWVGRKQEMRAVKGLWPGLQTCCKTLGFTLDELRRLEQRRGVFLMFSWLILVPEGRRDRPEPAKLEANRAIRRLWQSFRSHISGSDVGNSDVHNKVVLGRSQTRGCACW